MLQRHLSDGLLAFACAWLAGCAAGTPTAWENPADRSQPSMSDFSTCRTQARMQAEMRYPDQVIRPGNAAAPFDPAYRQQDPDRFPAEVRFYEMCLQKMGYVRK